MSQIILSMPQANQKVILPMNSDVTQVILNFESSIASFEKIDQDFILYFDNESTIILEEFYSIYSTEEVPSFVLDGQFLEGEDFFAALGSELMPAAGSEEPTQTIENEGFAVEGAADILAFGLSSLEENSLAGGSFFTYEKFVPQNDAPIMLAYNSQASDVYTQTHPQAPNHIQIIGTYNKGELLVGSSGDDLIFGLGGQDQIKAGDGNDIIYTEASPDQVQIVISRNPYDDVVDGEGGNDQIFTGAGNDLLYGGTGDDYLDGGADNDLLFAGAGDDYLDGGTGNDTLYGGEGNDTLIGGAGNDTLIGGAGSDLLSGNDGNDTFVFKHADFTDGANDIITDFESGDVLDLSNFASQVMTIRAEESGNDTVITIDMGTMGSQTITLKDVAYDEDTFADGFANNLTITI